MNQQFNLSRFSLLLKHYWAETGKSYLISLGLIIGIMLLLMIPIVGTSRYHDLLFILHAFGFLGGIMLGGSLFTSTAFSAYSTPGRGMATSMLPASQLEKFVVILLAHLLFAVLIFVVGYLLHNGLVDIANQNLSVNGRKYQPAPADVMRFFGFSYFLLQGTLFLGSLYFTKNAFIKTLGIVLGVTVLAFIVNMVLAYQFTGEADRVMTFPFTLWNVSEGQQFYQVGLPSFASTLVRLFLGLIVVAFGYITFVRLQEKEI